MDKASLWSCGRGSLALHITNRPMVSGVVREHSRHHRKAVRAGK